MKQAPHILESARPRQWIKNLVVFAPLVFAGKFFEAGAVIDSILAFLLLCLLSSALYLINDVRDVTEDREHPTKKDRPIAAGKLLKEHALVFATGALLVAVVLSFLLGPMVFVAVLGFIAVNALYVTVGKKIAILDVMLIGASFVMRVLVGAAAIAVPASIWLLLTLFTLAMYLGFTKRASELKMGTESRASLRDYTTSFLDQARLATLAVTLTLYTLYTFVSPAGQGMALTVPFVFFGLLRYQAIVDRDTGKNDGPSDHIYNDRQMQVTILLWALSVVTIILLTP